MILLIPEKHVIAQDRLQLKGYTFDLTADTGSVAIANARTYSNHGEWHSEYLKLIDDGRFVFIRHAEGAMHQFAAGTWVAQRKKRIVLNSNDSLSTMIGFNNDSCRKYNLHPGSFPVAFHKMAMRMKKRKLVMIGFDGNVRRTVKKANQAIRSMDFSSIKIITDSFYYYTPGGDTVARGVREFYHDQQGGLLKIVRTAPGDTANSIRRYSIYFLPNDIVKVENILTKKSKQLDYYFSGQTLVYADKKEDAPIEYDVMKMQQQAFADLYKKKMPDSRQTGDPSGN